MARSQLPVVSYHETTPVLFRASLGVTEEYAGLSEHGHSLRVTVLDPNTSFNTNRLLNLSLPLDESPSPGSSLYVRATFENFPNDNLWGPASLDETGALAISVPASALSEMEDFLGSQVLLYPEQIQIADGGPSAIGAAPAGILGVGCNEYPLDSDERFFKEAEPGDVALYLSTAG